MFYYHDWYLCEKLENSFAIYTYINIFYAYGISREELSKSSSLGLNLTRQHLQEQATTIILYYYNIEDHHQKPNTNIQTHTKYIHIKIFETVCFLPSTIEKRHIAYCVYCTLGYYCVSL